MEEAAISLAPIYFLDSRDKHPPMDFQDYLAGCVLTDWATGEHRHHFLTDLGPEARSASLLARAKGMKKPTLVPVIDYSMSSALRVGDKAPLYYLIDGNRVTYLNFHAYNPAGGVGCVKVKSTAHHADLEHVTLELAQNEAGEYRVVRARYEKHGFGLWTDAENLTFIDDRPVVYVARNSHASLEAKVYSRFRGYASDKCNGKVPWTPAELVRLRHTREATDPECRWIFFRGTLGSGRIDNVCKKDWFRQQVKGEPEEDVEDPYAGRGWCL